MIENWLVPTLALLPVLAGVLWGVGVPWALVVLPRRDWRCPVMVAAVGLALGAVLLTAGMFVLGTLGTITAGGTVALGAGMAAVGAALAWRRRKSDPGPAPESAPLAAWERLIVALLVIAVLARLLRTAYWPFAAYDPLWVFGYNGRVFTLTGQIPQTTGYYPQLLALLYAFGQMVWGGINDHAARAIIPLFALGSILAAYLLGARLLSEDRIRGRRLGLLTAFLWTAYPLHADWSRFGDLEIPLTFFFTLAALFFLLAWREESRLRWRYAAVAGLMLGGAMWTKPTAGALVWGILLLLLVEAVRLRLDWRRLWPRVRIVLLTGLAAAPIGGMWYLRNLALGHPAVVFPGAFWLTQAQRSGQELFWPLLAASLLAVWLAAQPDRPRPDLRLLLPGLALMLLGALPSAGLPAAAFHPVVTRRLTGPEVAAILIGLALYAAAVIRWWRAGGNAQIGRAAPRDALGVVLLILPYWLTWFWSYSYHPRLAFAIVPLQILLIAALALKAAGAAGGRLCLVPRGRQRLAAALLVLLALPGLWITLEDTVPHLIAGDLPDDDAKQLASNYALARTVFLLRREIDASDRPVRIVAPGDLRLPFFFPDLPVTTDPVTDLAVLDEGVTHFIDGFEAGLAYDAIGQGVNPARGAMGLSWLAEPLAHEWDGDFYYDVYRIDTSRRHQPQTFNGYLEDRVLYPFAEVLGYSMTGLDFWPGRRIILNIVFHVLEETDRDYTIYLHVMEGDRLVATWDHVPGNARYPTSLWQAGEYIEDRAWVELGDDVSPGTYRVEMGFYDLATGERVPARVGSRTADGFLLVPVINKLVSPPAQ